MSLGERIFLPYPRKITAMSVEEAILLRRSYRSFKSDPINIEHLALILWSAYGVSDPINLFRASPSAGATYPLEVYVAIGERGVIDNTSFIPAGIYRYEPYTHTLNPIKYGDIRRELARAALDQIYIEEAPIDIVITAIYRRTTRYYGKRGEIRYVPMDVGHMGQNIYLIATALGYGTVAIGAFNDDEVAKVLGCSKEETPIYIMPIGIPREYRKIDFSDIKIVIENHRKKLSRST